MQGERSKTAQAQPQISRNDPSWDDSDDQVGVIINSFQYERVIQHRARTGGGATFLEYACCSLRRLSSAVWLVRCWREEVEI